MLYNSDKGWFAVLTKKIVFSEKLVKGRIAYDRIAKLQNLIAESVDCKLHIMINMEGQRLGRTFIFLLGCMIPLANAHGKTARMFVDAPILKQLQHLDIIDYFSNPETKMQRFRRLKTQTDVFQLVPEIINEAPITMSDGLEEEMVTIVGEMYNNALEHSGAEFIMGGKYFKGADAQHNRFCFSCYDTGQGIPANIRNFLKKDADAFPDEETVKWAIQRGNTTLPGTSRGLGLDFLIKLAKINAGAIRICSGHTLFEYSYTKGPQYYKLHHNFLGTLFEMDIIADKANLYGIKRREEND